MPQKRVKIENRLYASPSNAAATPINFGIGNLKNLNETIDIPLKKEEGEQEEEEDELSR